MSEIEIRLARPGDGVGCAKVWLDIGNFFAAIELTSFQTPAAEGLVDWFEEIIARLRADEAMLHLVTVVDGVIVGIVSAALREPVDSAGRQLQKGLSRRRLHVDSLGVAGTHRRSGVGSALMRAVEEWGRSRGAEVMTLETELGNSVSGRSMRSGWGSVRRPWCSART